MNVARPDADPDVAPTLHAVADLVVVRVSGADRLDYLDDVSTQAFRGAAPGQALRALLLDATGSPTGVFEAVIGADEAMLLVPTAVMPAIETLAARTFLAQITFTVTQKQVVSVRGAGSPALVGDLLAAGPTPASVTEVDGLTLVGRAGGVDVVGDPARLDGLRERLEQHGCRAGDARALERHRIVAGEPGWGSEIAPPHLPEELGLLATHVHLAKGCYPGQEAVARMWMLGRPRRRLARVAIEGAVTAGWESGEGRARVQVTGVDEAAGVGLAFVPPTAEAGDRFGGDGSAVSVVALVGDGEPVPGHDPKQTRRRDRTAATPAGSSIAP